MRWMHLLLAIGLIGFVACSQATNEVAEVPPEPTVPPTATTAPTETPVPTETPLPEPTWELVWQDEFDGATIDETKWSFEVNGKGGGNSELQYYTDRPENAFIEDGHLVIQAIEEEKRYIGRDYTSARMRTLGKGDWLYGRFEIRARLPEGQGLWPAIWMLPSTYRYGGWPTSGEIDIMELLGHKPEVVHGTIHYGGLGDHKYTGKPFHLDDGDFASDFHTFALEWEEEEMRWYVDDELYLTQSFWYTKNFDYPAPFDQQFHLILNVAVGGNWPGSPDETTVFPQRMEVDYVRVYQKPAG